MPKYQDIRNKIFKEYSSFTKNYKKIADYLLDNLDDVSFLSVQQISEATRVSVASIVRFAQAIGYSGFQEMRESITKMLKTKLEQKEIFSLIEDDDLKSDTLTTVARQEIENINNTLHLVNRKNFDNAVSKILKAKRVFTAGLGISFLLSEMLAYQLRQVAIKAANFTHSSASFQEQLLYLEKGDLIIAFSFPPYSIETIELVEAAKEKGIESIALTNKIAAPINHHASEHIVVQSKNMLFTNSFAAISVIINALITACAVKDKQRAEQMLKELNKLVNHQQLVIPE